MFRNTYIFKVMGFYLYFCLEPTNVRSDSVHKGCLSVCQPPKK